jgi:[ribosomal protein S5]-alanine N-acetyltransferase
VLLVPATTAALEALARDRASFGALLGVDVPDGWPEFPEAIDFTIDRLRSHPDEQQWWLHFFVVDAQLVGSGGFTGPPQHGVAEIGYEIAPAHRNRGYATAAASAMIEKASGSGEVTTVIAHTLPQPSPSTGVLTRLGFTHVADVVDPDEGPVWRWERHCLV